MAKYTRTRNLLLKIAGGIGVVVIIVLVGTTALADGIVFVGPNHDNKIVPPLEVLSLQHHGNNNTETGGVSFNGANDVLLGDTSAGPHNVTVPFTSLGATASQLGILFNINENNGNGNSVLRIDSLVLTAYSSSNGSPTFIGSIENLSLDQIRPAQGSTSDYQFGLDSAAVARLEAALLLDPNLRLGLSGTISDVGGGPERFRFNAVTAVPEPATLLLFGSALAGIGVKLRQRRWTKCQS